MWASVGERADTECREVNSCDILFQRRHSPKSPSQPSARCFPIICVFVVTSMHMDSDCLSVGYIRQKAFRKSDDLGKRWKKPVFRGSVTNVNMWATKFVFPLC